MRRPLAAAAVLVLALAAPADAQVRRAQPAEQGPYEISSVDVMPQPQNPGLLMEVLRLLYPPHLRDEGVSGTVTLRFVILPSGAVDPESVRVVYSTHPDFTAAATIAIRILQFRPAEVNGMPVRVRVEQPLMFVVDPEQSF
ncbi:MAG TPA: energy transducer TonB [Longimicrobium sp.]|nr:energy transducer TonB [Longimicrobium sp.]